MLMSSTFCPRLGIVGGRNAEDRLRAVGMSVKRMMASLWLTSIGRGNKGAGLIAWPHAVKGTEARW
jgi:hypothetical protein